MEARGRFFWNWFSLLGIEFQWSGCIIGQQEALPTESPHWLLHLISETGSEAGTLTLDLELALWVRMLASVCFSPSPGPACLHPLQLQAHTVMSGSYMSSENLN